MHPCIDGYSRACLYVKCSDNNSAGTVLHISTLPTTVRTDHGDENIGVWRQMLQHADENCSSRPPVLVGSSVHNQRVEWFNREIKIHTRQKYGHIFYNFESQGVLDVTDGSDIFALHYIYLPWINNSLKLLMESHNNHPISTEHNKSPKQRLLHMGEHQMLDIPALQANPCQVVERECSLFHQWDHTSRLLFPFQVMHWLISKKHRPAPRWWSFGRGTIKVDAWICAFMKLSSTIILLLLIAHYSSI